MLSNSSETRWGGVGPCARRFIRSLLVGVESLVAFAHADEEISKYHLSGFRRATPPVRQFLGVACAASRVSEVMGVELLAADRLLLQAARCLQLVDEEFEYLQSALITKQPSEKIREHRFSTPPKPQSQFQIILGHEK